MKRIDIRQVDSGPLLVFLISFLLDLGAGAVNFSEPLYAYSLGATQSLIGIIAAVFGLTYILSAIYSPKVVSGKKMGKTMLLLIGCYTLIVALYIFVKKPVLFVAIRGLEGFVLGNLYPLTDTLPAATGDSRRTVPWYNAGWALSYTVAPFVLGYLVSLLGFAPSFVFAALSLAAALLLVALSQERLGLGGRANIPKTMVLYRGSLVDIVVLPAFIAAFITAVYSSLYPAYLASQSYGYELIGAISGAMSTSRTLTLALAGRIQAALGLRGLRSLGYALSALIAIPTFVRGVAEQFVCAVGVGVGIGLLYHVGLSGSLEREEGYLTNTFEASLGTGFFGGPLLGAALSGLDPGYVYGGVSVVPLVLLVRSVKKDLEERRGGQAA